MIKENGKNKRNWAELSGRKGKRYMSDEDKASKASRPVRSVRPTKPSKPAGPSKSTEAMATNPRENDKRFEKSYDSDYDLDRDDIIIGRNPVIEALKNNREIEKLIVGKDAEGSINKILGMAKDMGLIIHRADRVAMDRMAGGRPHQGIIAYISAYKYGELEDIFAKAEEKGEDPFIIILDNLEDPHNLGAIMRTAECAGAHGVIIPKRRSCGLTETVVKASAGAVEYIPCVKVSNIVQTINTLKEKGIWIAACDMDGVSYYKQDLSGKLAIVIGSEGFGINKLVKENCDYVVSMPIAGKISSLNASNAAAVLMYEVRRQRDVK